MEYVSSMITSMNTNHAGRHASGFGPWLERQMKANGWNQTDFARRLEVSQGTVSRWIQGRQPEATYIDRIADVLALDYDLVATKAGYRPHELLQLDPDSATAQLMPLIEKIDWESDPGRLEGVRLILQGYLEVDRRRKAAG